MDEKEIKDTLFHNAFKQNKGVEFYPIESDGNPMVIAELDALQKVINSFIRNNKKLPKIHLAFLNDEELGAKATKWFGMYFIGLNIGSYYILINLFSRMLACPKIFENIGDLKLERKDFSKYKMGSSQFKNFDDVYADTEEFIGPNDLTRKEVAKLLVHTSLLTLVLHEFTHIKNGHIDYLITTQTKGEKISPLTSQTLEYDADCFSLNFMIKAIINSNLAPEKINIQLLRPIFADLYEIIKLTLFAQYSTFRILSLSKDLTKNELESNNYMPPNLRQFIHMEMLLNLAEKYPNYLDIDKMKTTVINSVKEAEIAFDIISEIETDTKAIKLTSTEKYQNHLTKVTKHWAVVRPILEPFSFTKLPPINSSH